MTGYVRKDTTNNIADGNVINAADLDAEFDGVQDAFNASTGHKHDGTAGEGATINALGPTQDVTISATLVAPKTTNTVDIGSSSLKFKDLFLAGNGSIGGTLAVTGVATLTAQPILSSLTASRAVFTDGSKGLVSNAITGTGNVVMSASPTLTGTITAEALTASGAITGNGNWTIGNADTDTITQGASYVTGTQLRSAKLANNTLSLSAYDVDGTSYTDLVTVSAGNTPTLELVSTGLGAMNNIMIGGTTPAAAYFTTLSASSTVTLSGGTANGVAYLNGSKVVTSGSALVFDGTNLGVGTASPTVITNYVTQTINGTSGSFTEYQQSGTNTFRVGADSSIGGFLFTQAANPIRFGINGSEQMRLTSTGLGIGTSSPSAKLHVASSGRDVAIIESTDAGALNGPYLNLYRNSASPAANDYLGFLQFSGKNSSGSAVDYAFIGTQATQVTTSPAQKGDLVFFTANEASPSEKLRLDSAGNLGLGVTPSAANRAMFQSQYGIYAGQIESHIISNGYYDSSWKYVGTGYAPLYYNSSSDGAHKFFTAPSGTAGTAITFTQAMTLDSSGRLGIGTSSPTAKLTISGTAATGATTFLSTGTTTNYNVGQFTNTGGSFYFGLDNNAGTAFTGSSAYGGVVGTGNSTSLGFVTNSTVRATIDSSGNLGIGTSSPQTKLDVASTNTATDSIGNAFIKTTDTQAADVGGKLTLGGLYNASSYYAFGGIAGKKENSTSGNVAGYLQFLTTTSAGALTERARIDSSGNLFVGTTNSAYVSGERVSIVSASTKNGIGIAVSGTGAKGIGIYNANSSGATSGTMLEFQNSSSSVVGSITATGTATAYNTSSDQRLKENIQDADSASTLIDSLQVRQFDWKADGSHQRYGFVAQELVTVAPEAVHQPENTEEMMAVDYSKLVPMLVKEIQSLRQRVAQLESN